MRRLRAARYATGCDPALIEFITGELPFLSFSRAVDYYRSVVPHMRREEFALLAANDRFALLTQVLRRPDINHEWLYERCREVEAAPDDHLDLWARYHYKSTIITFGGSISEIIDDPEVTIAIFAGTDDVALPFLEQIKTECEENPVLPWLYPDVFYADPRNQAPQWSAVDGITVKREGNPRESTVEAHGIVSAMPTGKHFKLRVYDDLINERSVTSDEMIVKIMNRWELSQNLGAGLQGDRKWHAGTRYFYADCYGALLERGSLKPRIYPATDDGTLSGTPVLLSEEKWEEIKRDQRSTVSAQMLMNPVAGNETIFRIEWLRPYQIRPRILNVYILVDPSKGKTRSSDRTAIVVIGVDSALNRYLLDGYCHRMRLSDRWQAIKELRAKWINAPGVQNVEVGYEIYGQQVDDEYFQEKMIEEKESFSITEVNWTREGKQSKTDRVERLEPYFKNSRFFINPKVWHPDHGACRWVVQENAPAPIYTPDQGETREERQARENGEHFRVMQPIKRLDEQGNVYDFTRMFFSEFILFPFSQHKDLIDAMSRIEDMDVVPPLVLDRVVLEPISTPDA